MKPFNLELAKQGHPVCTRNGNPIRIICFDRNDTNYRIVALMKNEDGGENILTFNEKGKFHQTDLVSENDLFMLGEKKTGWINIYTGPDGDFIPSSTIYDNEHEAEEAAFGMSSHVDTIQIEFEV